MKIFVRGLVLFALSQVVTSARADCWTVTGLSGTSIKKGGDYSIVKDGISKGVFHVQINGQGSAVVPNDLSCSETNPNSVLCVGFGDEKSTVETWTIDPQEGIAYYSKSISGWGFLDGVSAFKGTAKKGC